MLRVEILLSLQWLRGPVLRPRAMADHDDSVTANGTTTTQHYKWYSGAHLCRPFQASTFVSSCNTITCVISLSYGWPHYHTGAKIAHPLGRFSEPTASTTSGRVHTPSDASAERRVLKPKKSLCACHPPYCFWVQSVCTDTPRQGGCRLAYLAVWRLS